MRPTFELTAASRWHAGPTIWRPISGRPPTRTEAAVFPISADGDRSRWSACRPRLRHRPTFATGRLGASQLAALDRLLADLAGERCCRVVLLHHPPLAAVAGWRRRLIDAEAFRRIILRRGADLVLHGHEHLLLDARLQGPDGPIPVAGVPSASSLDPRPERGARYRIYDIGRSTDGWTLRSQIRAYRSTTGSFGPLSTEAVPPC